MSHGPGTFYNTTDLQGSELAASKKRVRGQEAAILGLFRRHPLSHYSRTEIELYFNMRTSSAARALANLTAGGHLEKSETTIKDRLTGASVHTWRLRPIMPPVQERLF